MVYEGKHILEMRWILWPGPPHQALLQTCCSQSCSSAGWLALKHREGEKIRKIIFNTGKIRGKNHNDFTWYRNIQLCIWTHVVGFWCSWGHQRRVEASSDRRFVRTTVDYCHETCRLFLLFPLRKSSTAFPDVKPTLKGLTRLVWQLHLCAGLIKTLLKQESYLFYTSQIWSYY